MATVTTATAVGNTVRIIARVRPLLKGEIEKDIVVYTEGTAISMPNPKNENENFTFPFNAVHDGESDQSQLFSEGKSRFHGCLSIGKV